MALLSALRCPKPPSKIPIKPLALGLLFSTACLSHADLPSQTTLHVSQNGDDSGDGSSEHPFATLEQAQTVARKLRTKAAVSKMEIQLTVLISPGTYIRKTPFTLSLEDSGTEASPTVWKAETPGTVRLDVGTHLSPKDFQPLTPEDSPRLAPEAQGHVLKADLKALGIRHHGPLPLNSDNGGGLTELFFNNQRQPISRWPNDEPSRIERITDKGESAPGEPKRTGSFVSRDARVARWPVDRGVWVEGYWRVPWDNRTVRVAKIDPATREISLAAPVGGGIGSKYGGNEGSGTEPWWGVNLLEEIDRPGEWCIDFKNENLYWWPQANWQEGEIVLSDLGESLIRIEKASHLKVQGIELVNSLSHGVEVRESQFVEIAGCTVRNCAGSGVVIQKGSHNTVRSCDISEVGHSGIVLSGGDRAQLSPCAHLAENNHIHHVGVLKKTYAPGILVGIFGSGDAVGCRVAHNFIHDVPHGGIQYGGNDHVFEYNEISQAVLTSDDMGAFYTSNDWTSCGNLVRHNFVHHSPNAVSFYMDDGDGGDTITGNIAYEMQAGTAVCGGHYNAVHGNLLIRCKRGLSMDARGVARVYDKTSSLFKKLNAVPFDQSPWKERFPYLQHLPDSDTRLPQGNEVTGNVTVHCEKPVRISGKPEEIAGSTFKDNLDLGSRDAFLKNEQAGDLTLNFNSPIFTEMPGFISIPFSKIGCYLDDLRTSLPSRQWENPPAFVAH